MTDIQLYTAPTDSWVPMLTAVGDLAQKLSGTKFVPKAMQGQPASVAAAILLGREMGLGPMASLRGIDVVEGKPSLTATMLAARILAAGHAIEWVEVTDTKCTVRITRCDGLSTHAATWTKADAERAKLWGKGAWVGYPRAMLRHRALTEAAGMTCPDVLMGLDVGDTPVDDGPRPAGLSTVVQIGGGEPSPLPETVVGTDPVQPPPVNVQPAIEPPVPEDDGLVTPAQLRKLNALLGELDRAEGRRLTRDERRVLIGSLAGVDGLDSAKDLTRIQASTAIDQVAGMVAAILDAEHAEDAVVVEEVPGE